ncbi:MAG: copper-binding protein [Pseudomonadota bacterium]
MNKLNPILLAALLGLSSAAVAPLAQAQQAVASKDAMSEGEIRKVDKDLGKLTIKHGELKNLGMGAMTMVFRAKEPAMLDQVKQGDKVRFVAELVGGALTVTSIQTAN